MLYHERSQRLVECQGYWDKPYCAQSSFGYLLDPETMSLNVTLILPYSHRLCRFPASDLDPTELLPVPETYTSVIPWPFSFQASTLVLYPPS